MKNYETFFDIIRGIYMDAVKAKTSSYQKRTVIMNDMKERLEEASRALTGTDQKGE